MALGAILGESLSGAPPDEVATIPADAIFRIFGKELSMGKSLGLMNMLNMVRSTAVARVRENEQLAASRESP